MHALADTLHALGDLAMTDVQAVELGHEALARHLRAASGNPERDLSFDATLCLRARSSDTACLHILHFFTAALVLRGPHAGGAEPEAERTHRQGRRVDRADPVTPAARTRAFEQRYLALRRHQAQPPHHLRHRPGQLPRALAAGRRLSQPPGRCVPRRTRRRPARTGRTSRPPAARLRADQALAEQDLVLLRGVAGSGKTTLVQWLAVTAARGERGDRIPFVLPLRTLVRRADGPPGTRRFPLRRPRPLPRHPAGRLERPCPRRGTRSAARRRHRRDPRAGPRADPRAGCANCWTSIPATSGW